MARADRGSRAARALLLCVALAPAPATAIPITDAAVDQATHAELAGGIAGPGCPALLGCSDSKTNTGPGPFAAPEARDIDSSVATAPGTSALSAYAYANLALRDPADLELFYPDAVLVGSFLAEATIVDAPAAGVHASAAASMSSDDFVQFALPALAAGEQLLMEVFLLASDSDLTTAFDATLEAFDVTSGVALASFDEASPGSAVLDLSGLAGHEIRVSLAADLAVAGDAGFGGGEDLLTRRSFSTLLNGGFVLSQLAVPEPSPALLVGSGLAALGARRRRRLRG